MTTKTKTNKLARGDKRMNGVRIVRASKLTAKSSAEAKTKVVEKIAAANKFSPAAARSMVNWILRNGKIVASMKTSTTAKKKAPAQAAA